MEEENSFIGKNDVHKGDVPLINKALVEPAILFAGLGPGRVSDPEVQRKGVKI